MSVAKNANASQGASLIDSTKRYFTPEVVQRLSLTLGEPAGKVSSGLLAAVPTFFAGLVKMGSSELGVGNLIDLIRQGGFDRRLPSEISPGSPDPMAVDSLPASGGTNLVSRVFGDQTAGIVQAVASAVGMKSTSASGLFGAIAPVAFSVLGQQARATGFNALALKDLLMSQKDSIFSALPAGLKTALGSLGFGLPFGLGSHPIQIDAMNPVENRSWVRPAVLGGIALLLVGLFFGTRQRIPAPPSESVGVSSSAPAPAPLPAPTSPSSNDELSLFLASPERAALPKRLVFEELNFDFGTTRLTEESLATVEALAGTLREHPDVTLRLEGHTDNVGNPDVNERLSRARASAVRDLLVERGIESSRLQVAGRGQAVPIQSNDTEQGRQANRRIEVVVLTL